MSLLSKLKDEFKEEWRDFQREFRDKWRDPLMKELTEALLGKLADWIPEKYRDRILTALGKFIYSLLFTDEDDG